MMTKNQKKQLNNLTEREIWLIERLRAKYQFGRVTIVMHDGQPKKIEQVINFDA